MLFLVKGPVAKKFLNLRNKGNSRLAKAHLAISTYAIKYIIMLLVGLFLLLPIAVWGQVSEFTDMFGSFESPTDGLTYPNDLNVTWSIKTNLPGKSIAIVFTHFDIEDSYELDVGACIYDYVKISGGNLVISLCGKSNSLYNYYTPTLNQPIIVNAPTAKINFVTDYSNADPIPTGFKAHYNIVDRDICEIRRQTFAVMVDEDWEDYLICSQTCTNIPPNQYKCTCEEGFTLHADKHSCSDNCGTKMFTELSGTIQPTLYEGKYAKMTNCEWIIKGDIGDNVELKFDIDFDIESHYHEGCVYDWIEYETKSGSVKKFCGNETPSNGTWIKTYSPLVKVRFVTDRTIEASGFKLYYRLHELDIYCERLDAPLHGSMTPSVVEKPEYQDQVVFKCDKGYPMIGARVLTCSLQGQWNTLPPLCHASNCIYPHHLDNLHNGRIHPPITSMEVGVGTVQTICNEGYELVKGSQSWLCDVGSSWVPQGNFFPNDDNSNVPICEKIGSCPFPSHLMNLRNGKIKPALTGTRFDQDTFVHTVCDRWHELQEGSELWICREGEWHPTGKFLSTSDDIPQCEPVSGLKGNPAVLNGTIDGFAHTKIPTNKFTDWRSSLISGGLPAKKGEWPWLAFVDIDNTGLGVRTIKYCGGSLIHKKVVLTAAHCFKYENGKNASHYQKTSKVFLGVHNRNNMTHVQTFSISKLIRHANFTSDRMNDDIALIILNENAIINKWVRPIRIPICSKHALLPKRGQRRVTGYEEKGYIAGWGSGPNEGTSAVMQHAEIPMMRRDTCEIFYKDMNKNSLIEILPTMLCGGKRLGEQDSCQGDSGGPFMYRDNDSGRWYVNGIVSFGSSVGCGVSYFGIYTKVSSYISWIESIFMDNGMQVLANSAACP